MLMKKRLVNSGNDEISDRNHTQRMSSLLEKRADTSSLRESWKHKFAKEQRGQPYSISIASALHNRLRMRAALRYHTHAVHLSDNRISERGDYFLPIKEDEYERNLSTPKYFTKLNTRSSMPRLDPVLKAENFRTLTSKRLDIPTYQVPQNLPELSDIRSLVTSPQEVEKSEASHKENTSYEKKSADLNEWISLVTRPPVNRPEFAEPIRCQTPHLKLNHPDYQKPSMGFFKAIDKRAAHRDYTVHPEFISEGVNQQYIQGLSSNPLKYGWA